MNIISLISGFWQSQTLYNSHFSVQVSFKINVVSTPHVAIPCPHFPFLGRGRVGECVATCKLHYFTYLCKNSMNLKLTQGRRHSGWFQELSIALCVSEHMNHPSFIVISNCVERLSSTSSCVCCHLNKCMIR